MTYLLRLVACLLLCVSLNSFAALSIRDLDGDWSNGHEGVYDDVLDITWLADANYAKTSGHNSDGKMNREDAISLADNLSIDIYSDWRLPKIISFNIDNYFYHTGSEIGHLFFIDLNNQPESSFNSDTCPSGAFHSQNQPSLCNRNSTFLDAETNLEHTFKNFMYLYNYDDNYAQSIYWLNDESQFSAHWNVSGMVFNTTQGVIDSTWPAELNEYAWPVHDGDIGASSVPLPAGIYLFLSGLVGLGLMRGRNA